MSENCLDIGTIQAFLDGELTPDGLMSVSSHIASCPHSSSGRKSSASANNLKLFSTTDVLVRSFNRTCPSTAACPFTMDVP